MESLEASGRTVEEAVEVALDKLGLSREEVEVEILEKGRSGILGLGGADARVRVTPRQPPQAGVAQMGQEVLARLLSLMGIRARVELEQPEEETEPPSPPILNIKGDDLGILIGRRGETLSALQYLVNLMVSRRLKARAAVLVDVDGYRQRRQQSLRLLAWRLAERVKSSGRPVTLEPMSAAERRIVHLALRDDPEVTTQSVGEGEGRKVAIFPGRKQ